MDHVAQTLAQENIGQTATSTALQYGVVGVVALVFAWVIVHLYKQSRADLRESAEKDKKHAEDLTKCQEQCKVEKEALRADHDRKHREVLEGYTIQLTQIRQQQEKREDDIRREFTATYTKLAEAGREKDEALIEMLDKLQAKLIK